MKLNCTKDICRTSHGKPQLLIQKGHCVLIITFVLKYGEISEWHHTYRKYSGRSREKVDEFINNKIDFNTTHIIKSDIQQLTNVPEEARFILSMRPTGFRNDQDESRCYGNSTFQVLFFNIYI